MLIFITPFLLALLVFAGIKLGSYIKNYEPAPEPITGEITDQTNENGQNADEDDFYNDPGT